MVSCNTPGTQTPCSNGALAGVFLYTGTGSELHVADGEQTKLQIITNAYVCDDSGFVPTEYCVDWDDGTTTNGTFKTGYGEPKNEELTHVYRYVPSDNYTTTSYVPVVTIRTACGGIRTTTGRGQGVSLMIYCHAPGTTILPPPNMSSYKLHTDFSFSSCAGIFTTNTPPSGGSTPQPPVSGNVGYIPPSGGGGGYVPPSGGGGGAPAGGSTDIMTSIKTFYEANPAVAIGGAVVVGIVLLSVFSS